MLLAFPESCPWVAAQDLGIDHKVYADWLKDPLHPSPRGSREGSAYTGCEAGRLSKYNLLREL